MNRKEFDIIIGELEMNHDTKLSENKGDFFFKKLHIYPFKPMYEAVDELIRSNVYPRFPTVGAIIQAYLNRMHAGELNSAEAYEEMIQAVRKFGYNERLSAYKELQPLTQKVCDAIGWQSICHSSQPDVIRGQFMTMYDKYQKRERDSDSRSQIAKNLIAQVGVKGLGDGK